MILIVNNMNRIKMSSLLNPLILVYRMSFIQIYNNTKIVHSLSILEILLFDIYLLNFFNKILQI
jgi:hypothetical protein